MFGKKKPTETKTSKKKTSHKAGEKSPSLQTPRPSSRSAVSSASPIPRGTAPKTPTAIDEFLYISNEAHYDQVIERIKTVKKTLWIGTADIKDLYVKDGRGTKPLLEVLSDLAKRGVEIRLIHAKEPGPAFRQDFDKYPASSTSEFIYISNEAHYDQVIERIKTVKKTLWIGTADIKDLYVKDGRGTKPLLEVLSDLAKRGVEIRLIHAKEPGPAFRQDFDKYPALIEGMERVLCPRVHFKIIVFDLKAAYVGSANLTGAGLGMKGENTRNFEAGILSTNRDFVKNAASQLDSVWMGAHRKGCKRKEICGDPIGWN